MPKIIEVIESQIARGDGIYTPVRKVAQYHDKDGNMLAENDPFSVTWEQIRKIHEGFSPSTMFSLEGIEKELGFKQ